jgi:hypothetical protein
MRNLRAWFQRAFALDAPAERTATEIERAVVDRLAHALVRRGLADAAILGLASVQPLSFLAGQAMLVGEPVARAILSGPEYDILATFLQRRGSIEYIGARIERFAHRDAPNARGEAPAAAAARVDSSNPAESTRVA